MNISEDLVQDILACIKGNASEKQIENLQRWLDLDKDNEITYRTILKSYCRLSYVRNWSRIDSFSAKRKVDEKLVYRKKNHLWYVAACIALLVSLISIFVVQQYEPSAKIVETTVIEPGEKGAELILSDGSRVQVMKAQKQLKEQNGLLIKVDSLKGVIYAGKSDKGSCLLYNTIKVARGQEFNLELSDGTKVWLNAESELRYPVQFLAKSRKVFLKGEAYFEVAPDKEKVFIVNSFNQNLKVYGTKFNINAYDKNLIKTVLIEGKVSVKLDYLNKETKMVPGDLLLANTDERFMTIKKVNVYPYIAWKDGYFLFRDESLESIMLRLGRWYNVKVFFKDSEARKQLFIGDMKRYTKIEKLLYFMEKSSEVKFDIKDDVIIVMSK